MRKLRRPGRRIMSTINVVPYIDVMLVLLVIFMITAPLMTQGVHVQLPKAQAKVIPMRNKVPIIVSVDRQGRYFVNVSPTPSVPVTAQQLVNLIAAEVMLGKEHSQAQAMFVKGDTDVDYGQVVKAMTLMQKAGVAEVGLLTQTPKIKPESQNDL